MQLFLKPAGRQRKQRPAQINELNTTDKVYTLRSSQYTHNKDGKFVCNEA